MRVIKILILNMAFLTIGFASILQQCKLEGVVITPFGTLVSHTKLRLVNKTDKLERNAETNTEGRYNFSNLNEGKYELEVFSPGCPVVKYEIEIKKGINIQDVGVAPELFEMKQPRFKLKGKLQTVSKLKPANLKINLVNPFHDQWSRVIQSKSDGKFEGEIPHAGQYILQVTASGFKIYAKVLFIEPEIRDKVIEIEVELHPIEN